MTLRVAVIVLAAGRGRRFGAEGQKAVALFRGRPLVRAVVTAALASQAVSVTIVTGPAHDDIAEALRGLDGQIIRNTDFATGIASSLRAGLATLPADIDGALVMLADMPLVRTETIDRLIARFRCRQARPHAVVPVFDGRRGNPVLIGRSLFAAAEALTGDEGARSLLQAPELRVELCEVDDPGIAIDVDTPEELEALDNPALSDKRTKPRIT